MTFVITNNGCSVCNAPSSKNLPQGHCKTTISVDRCISINREKFLEMTQSFILTSGVEMQEVGGGGLVSLYEIGEGECMGF